MQGPYDLDALKEHCLVSVTATACVRMQGPYDLDALKVT